MSQSKEIKRYRPVAVRDYGHLDTPYVAVMREDQYGGWCNWADVYNLLEKLKEEDNQPMEVDHWTDQVSEEEFVHREDCPCGGTGVMPVGREVIGEERVVAAALKDERTGMILFHEAPARHHNVLWSMAEWGFKSHGMSQGFVTSTGRFVSREEAFILAYNAKQLIRVHKEGELFSEDVW